jgi:hypothetical protein
MHPLDPPRPANVAPEVHAELVKRHWRLVSPERAAARGRRFVRDDGEQRTGDRRRGDRRIEEPGMAGIPGLDRRGRFERRAVPGRREDDRLAVLEPAVAA